MFDSLTPDELVQAMSNALRSAASSVATSGSEFDQVQCLSGASIGRYLAQELAHGRDLERWFRDRVTRGLADSAAGADGSIENLCLDLSRRIRAADELDETGGEIAGFLRDLANLPGADGKEQAESMMHGCLRDLANRQVRMLLGEYAG